MGPREVLINTINSNILKFMSVCPVFNPANKFINPKAKNQKEKPYPRESKLDICLLQ